MRLAIPLEPIVRAVAKLMVRRQMKKEGIDKNQVGIFGWIKKTIKKVARKAHKVAKSIGLVKVIKKATKIVKKVAKTAKDVFKHPVFETAVTSIASIVPGGAAIVQGAYKAAKGRDPGRGARLRRRPAGYADDRQVRDAREREGDDDDPGCGANLPSPAGSAIASSAVSGPVQSVVERGFVSGLQPAARAASALVGLGSVVLIERRRRRTR